MEIHGDIQTNMQWIKRCCTILLYRLMYRHHDHLWWKFGLSLQMIYFFRFVLPGSIRWYIYIYIYMYMYVYVNLYVYVYVNIYVYVYTHMHIDMDMDMYIRCLLHSFIVKIKSYHGIMTNIFFKKGRTTTAMIGSYLTHSSIHPIHTSQYTGITVPFVMACCDLVRI